MDALEETKYIVSKRCPQCGLPLREHKAKLGELVEEVMSCQRCKRMWTMVGETPCEQIGVDMSSIEDTAWFTMESLQAYLDEVERATKPDDSWLMEQINEASSRLAKAAEEEAQRRLSSWFWSKPLLFDLIEKPRDHGKKSAIKIPLHYGKLVSATPKEIESVTDGWIDKEKEEE